jgi:CRP-like cAMP-binding protein
MGQMDENSDWLELGVRAFLRRLDLRDQVPEAERQAIRSAAGEVKRFTVGEDLAVQHSSPNSSLLLASGVAARYSLLEMGDRQITAFHILGDFVDLHAFLLSRLDHGVSAATDVVAIEFPHEGLLKITEQFPHLSRMLWLSTLLDGAIHRQWLVAMGKMPAISHIAQLFCEHYRRAQVVNLGSDDRFPFDISLPDLADALGLSTVHVRRMINELHRRSLLEWTDGVVTIIDWKWLARLAQFDDTFLDMERRPR